MPVKIFVNPSPALADLIFDREISIDGLEFTPFHSPRQISKMRRDYPGLPFQFHASNMFRTSWSEHRLHRYHSFCPESKWISLHLAVTPAWVVFPALKFGIKLPVPSPDKLANRLIDKIQRLKGRVKLPLILENMPAHVALDTQYETDPQVIRKVMMETDCQMLLDLAHARVAADFRAMTVWDYLDRLPLNRVKQIHVSGVRKKNNILFDTHESLQSFDYEILIWALTHTTPEVVTLEYFLDDKNALRNMLLRIHECVDFVKK